MHFLDIDSIVRRYPQHETAIKNAIERLSKQTDAKMQTGAFYCAHSKIIREEFCAPIYEEIARIVYDSPVPFAGTDREMEDANAKLGVNVESQTQAGLVKVISALNVCKKCIAAGLPDEECRNVTSRMRFTRSWDEPGIEILTCQRCGHVWKR